MSVWRGALGLQARLTRLRVEAGHVRAVVRVRGSLGGMRRQIDAVRQITLHSTLPSSAEGRGPWAVSVVRDEADVLPHVINHLLAQGITRVLIADNMSQDGTWEFLQDVASRDPRVLICRDANPAHHQSEKMTYLAHLAWRSGATWIVPFDADEFWYAAGQTLAECFASTDCSVLYAGFHHSVPTGELDGPLPDAELVMDTADSFPGKVAFRAHPLAVVHPGNHQVTRSGRRARALDIVHVQYRGIEQIVRKVRQGASSSRLTGEDLSWFAPHWEAGSRLTRAEIAEVWANISAGRPDARIQFKAEGPMRRGRFLRWRSWNDDGSLGSREEA